MSEKVLSDCPRQLRFTHTSWTTEEQDSERAIGIVHTSLESGDQVSDGLASALLPDDLFSEYLEYVFVGERFTVAQKDFRQAGFPNELPNTIICRDRRRFLS